MWTDASAAAVTPGPGEGIMGDELWLEIFASWPALMAMARGLGMSYHDAEDVVSDAMVAAATYTALDRHRLTQLLRTSVRRDWLDAGRRRRRRQELDPVLANDSIVDSPETSVILRDEIDRVAAAAHLTPAEWSVVLLAAAGYSHLEIGTTLRITPHASEVALSRARHKIRAVGYA
jgi:RNA polymerase sigma factor (sigma-70 family)